MTLHLYRKIRFGSCGEERALSLRVFSLDLIQQMLQYGFRNPVCRVVLLKIERPDNG